MQMPGVNKGTSLYRMGLYNEAIGAYNEAIRIMPQNANAWYRKGFALKKLGSDNYAAGSFARAKEFGYKAN